MTINDDGNRGGDDDGTDVLVFKLIM